MKKLVFIIAFILMTASSLYAEKIHEVSLRSSRQDALIRIVLESDEDLIRNANTVATPASVRIEFPAPFVVNKPGDFIFDVQKRDRQLIFTLRDILDIRAYKLTSPARLVLDLKTIPQDEQKPLQDASTQTGQKPLKDPVQTEQKPVQGPPSAQRPQSAGQPSEQARTKTFVIDAGHGGYDYGLIDRETREKDVNLSLSVDLNALLSKRSYKSYLTRKADQPVSINERINFAGSKKPDLFISLHASLSDKFVIYTSAPDSQNSDTSLKLYSLNIRQARHREKSREVARSLGDAIEAAFPGRVLLRELPLPLLNAMNAPAVLIEHPVMKSPADDKKLREKFLNAILKGVTVND